MKEYDSQKEYGSRNIKTFRKKKTFRKSQKKKKRPTETRASCRECLESAPAEKPNRVKCYRWDTLVTPSRAECCPYFASKRRKKEVIR